MKQIRCILLAACLLGLTGAQASAQADYMECAACQLLLRLVESSAGDGKDIAVDASRQCSLLAAADRESCVKFYTSMGPKFIKALKDRRAKGESIESICRAMNYCQ